MTVVLLEKSARYSGFCCGVSKFAENILKDPEDLLENLILFRNNSKCSFQKAVCTLCTGVLFVSLTSAST